MSFQIPLFDLNFGPEEAQAVLETLQSRWISMGERTARFEAAFAALLGTPHAVALSNGTAALHLALRALDIGPGDEVIVPSLTFVATANCIRYVGATPVFADIHGADDLTLDPESVAEHITPRSRAILVMHYGGFPCQMTAMLELARQHELRVVEDAAHAPLSEWEGRPLGTLGEVGCFSFFSNKNLTTAEGGMLTTADPAIAERTRLLRSHGMTTLSYERARGHATAYDVVELGYNYRLDDIRAALGLVQLERLEGDLARRREVRRQYLEKLGTLPGVIVPFAKHSGKVSNYILPVVLAPDLRVERETVRNRMADAGVQTSVHYPPVHRFEIYQECKARLPRTEAIADRLLTLPMYGSMTEAQVELVVSALRKAIG